MKRLGHHGTTLECSECLGVFCGLTAFEAHRVGDHGVKEGPSRRRCLSTVEMEAKAFSHCDHGRWTTNPTSTTGANSVVAA